MKKIIIFLLAIITSNLLLAQTFINKASIEFEVKSNIKKNMGNNVWEEAMKDKLPTFKTGYYNFIFADNKSIYKFSKWNENDKMPDYMKKDDETSVYYTDFTTGKINVAKTKFGTTFNIEDTITHLDWQLTTESRNIAGFNCRKAVAKIFDSVYVFAFYTDEIMIPGGPCSIQGLPGMILGVTIPRLFTSYIATKVTVNDVPVQTIVPTVAKKYYTNGFLQKTILDRTADWYSNDDGNEENKQQKNRFIWSVML